MTEVRSDRNKMQMKCSILLIYLIDKAVDPLTDIK
jgi:hypothetical protein